MKLQQVSIEIIKLKRERNKISLIRKVHFQKYRKLLGREQQLSRLLNAKLDDLEKCVDELTIKDVKLK